MRTAFPHQPPSSAAHRSTNVVVVFVNRGHSAQPAVGRTVFVGVVQEVPVVRQTTTRVQAGTREQSTGWRRRWRRRNLRRLYRRRLLAIDRLGSTADRGRRGARPLRALGRVHTAGVRRDATVFAAATGSSADVHVVTAGGTSQSAATAVTSPRADDVRHG